MLSDTKTEGSSDNFTDAPFLVDNYSVMDDALKALTILNNTKKIRIRGKGQTCSNAVSVANIILENMLNGNSKAEKISVDSDIEDDGYMTSTIEIMITKIN